MNELIIVIPEIMKIKFFKYKGEDSYIDQCIADVCYEYHIEDPQKFMEQVVDDHYIIWVESKERNKNIRTRYLRI